MSELENMGILLIEIASNFTHPQFEDFYPEWSTVSGVGERLLEIAKEVQDENNNDKITKNNLG